MNRAPVSRALSALCRSAEHQLAGISSSALFTDADQYKCIHNGATVVGAVY